MNLFTRSTSIDPDDYARYMRSCWWNGKDVAAAAE